MRTTENMIDEFAEALRHLGEAIETERRETRRWMGHHGDLVRQHGEQLAEARAAALRDQDTWYEIDDPEHPAPRGKHVLAMILDEDEEEIWLPQVVIYAKHNHVPLYGWLRHSDTLDGEDMEPVRVSRWRSLPLPPPPQSGRGTDPVPDAGGADG